MLSGAWQVTAESCGLLYHAGGARVIVMVSNIFRDADNGSGPLAHFSLSYRKDEDNHYGLRMINKPLSRLNIESPLTRPPDNLGAVHLEVIVPLIYP